jgi:hypothetical protein
MREFIVTLRGGRRLTIKADRCVNSGGSVELVADAGQDAPMFSSRPAVDLVAVFERGEVVAVVATDHLTDETFEPTGQEIGLADEEA